MPKPEDTNLAIKWNMMYQEAYTIYIACRTTQGHRYLTYTPGLPSDYKAKTTDNYVRFALGNETLSGSWATITRNLQQDLWYAQPNSDIIEVYAFLIRGSGYIDNIEHMPETGALKTASIGITDVLTTLTDNSSARATGPFTVSDDGRIKSISVYHEGDNDTGATLHMAVYSDEAGVPGNKLGTTDNVQVNNSAGWQAVQLPDGVSVQAGQEIWLAWHFSVNPGMRFSWSEGNPMRYSELNNSLDYIFSLGGSSTAEYSLYATYSILSTSK